MKTNKQKFEHYASLCVQKRDIEKEMEKLNQELKNEMVEAEIQRYKSDFGTFSICKKQSWKYSKEFNIELKDMKEIIKNKTLYQQKKGLAESEIKSYLAFRVSGK